MKEILEEYGMTIVYVLLGTGIAGIIAYCINIISV